MERCGARRDGEHVLRLEVVAHPSLELGRPRAGRQPAGAEGRRDGVDLGLGDRRRLEPEEIQSLRRRLRHPRCRSVCGLRRHPPGRAPARGSRRWRGRRRRGRSRGAAARTRSPARGRSGRARRPSSPSGTSTASSTPGGAIRKRVTAPPTRRLCRVGTSVGSERGVDRQAVQVDAGHGLDELGVVAAAEARRDLDHRGPVGPDPKLGVGRAVRRSRARYGAVRDGVGHCAGRAADGQTCASATPNAGGSATSRSVTARPWKIAADREADHRHLGAVDELLDEREAVARDAARASRSRPAAPPGPRRASGPSGPAGRAP